MSYSLAIQTQDFDLGAEWTALLAQVTGRAGAVAAFCGLVRDRFDTATVSTLFLEHYPGMTERSIEVILKSAVERFDLQALRVIHRVGELHSGDQIVLVLCASAHRAAAFDACQFVMDFLKTDAVFWKKEAGSGGGRWVDSTAADQERSGRWKA